MSMQFRGSIGRTWQESKPWWPQPTQAPPDAPNIVIIILDDVGYGWLSCYGGSIETPNIDGLARNGLLYNNWHTTALCSPTRATLLTGRNHHSVSTGAVTDMATGFPGYDGRIPKEKATIAAALRKYGYNTFAVGKWHNTPAGETGPEGPFDRWPTGEMMGFDRFYGFLGGGCNQWYPPLVWDNHPIAPPKTPEEGYHLSVDLVDKAILFISNHESVAPEKPWFLWLAFGAAHAPHHVSKEWADKYKGKFDQGWDKVREETLARQKRMGIVPENTELAPPNEGVQKWDELSGDEKKLFARMMEVYAGFLSHTDHQIGKLISFLEEIGNIENTLMFVCSDNGASAEGMLTGLFNEASVFNMEPESTEENMKRIDELGGPTSYNHYPVGWAMAGDSPFKWYKQYTHYGGTKDPLIVHWPKGIRDRGKIRTQFHHSADIVPTIFEAVGVDPPAEIGGYAQAPLEGVSMLYSFNDAIAPSRKQIQYFEMLGNRAIWRNGWKAVTYHGRLPWENKSRWSFDEDKWELYNVEEDFSECKDLADKHPEKLRQLVELWWAEAGKYNVLPLDDRFSERVVARNEIDKEKKSYTFYPGTVRVPENSAPHFKNRSYSINAEVEIPKAGAEGPICAIGGIGSGWSLYIKDKKLMYCYNYLGKYYYLKSKDHVPTGRVKLGFEFEKTGKEKFGAGGIARLYINGNKAGELKIPRTVRFVYSMGESFDIGRDSGTAVTPEYKHHAEFTGTIKKIVIDLAGEKHIDSEAEARMFLVEE
ncbi:MAG: arylsulfatase [Thermoproteota archaeon]|nr:arylsulfatase [Thermoproteota archaeon]